MKYLVASVLAKRQRVLEYMVFTQHVRNWNSVPIVNPHELVYSTEINTRYSSYVAIIAAKLSKLLCVYYPLV